MPWHLLNGLDQIGFDHLDPAVEHRVVADVMPEHLDCGVGQSSCLRMGR
jgi:hypothetical protein